MSAGDLVIWPNGGTEFPVNYREQNFGFRWTSPFGMRTHPVTGAPETFHYGLDLIGWSIIKSPYTGVVTFAGYNGGAGNEARIREDGTGDYVRLMHNSALLLKTGQRVTQGQDVAVMGTTGSSTGIHCHEEIHPGGGAAVDPMGYYQSRNASAAGGGSKPFEPNTSEEEDEMNIVLYFYLPDNRLVLVDHLNKTFRDLGKSPTDPVRDYYSQSARLTKAIRCRDRGMTLQPGEVYWQDIVAGQQGTYKSI